MKRGVFAVLFILFFPVLSFAAHPLITDDAGTQGRGRTQIEFNGELDYDRQEQDGMITRQAGGEAALIVSRGITDRTDLVIGLPYRWFEVKEGNAVIEREDGIADVSLDWKWRFYEKEGLSLALKPGLTLPTGNEDRGLGSGRTTYSLYFIATREIEPWTFHANVGYTRNENRLDERKDLWHVSLASELAIARGLKAVANVGAVENPEKESSTAPAFLLGGFIYSLTENVDVDCGVKKGLNASETDYSFLAGMAFRF